MKVLLVYPATPETFWSFQHVLRFVSKRAAFPPLGLLTVAALLPADWEVKLVDMNVQRLTDDDLRWADYVLLSAMIVHKASVSEIANRCRRFARPIIAGGPLFTTGHTAFPEIDFRNYVTMSVQFSRGCAFDCEFCDIIVMNGRVPRTKTPAQLVAELEQLRLRGWHGMVFVVDDNFIGNKRQAKALLRELIHRSPFPTRRESVVNGKESGHVNDLDRKSP